MNNQNFMIKEGGGRRSCSGGSGSGSSGGSSGSI